MEELKYDRRVHDRFQRKAWCDEKIMADYVHNFWKPKVHGEMLLPLDQYTTHKTPSVLSKPKDKCNTKTAFTYVQYTSCH